MLLAGGAGLLVANVQSGNLIEEYYKKQVPVVTAFDCSAECGEAAEASCCPGNRLCSGLLRAFALSPSLLGPVMCLATLPSRIWTVYSCKTSLPSSTMSSLEPTVRLATLLAP